MNYNQRKLKSSCVSVCSGPPKKKNKSFKQLPEKFLKQQKSKNASNIFFIELVTLLKHLIQFHPPGITVCMLSTCAVTNSLLEPVYELNDGR